MEAEKYFCGQIMFQLVYTINNFSIQKFRDSEAEIQKFDRPRVIPNGMVIQELQFSILRTRHGCGRLEEGEAGKVRGSGIVQTLVQECGLHSMSNRNPPTRSTLGLQWACPSVSCGLRKACLYMLYLGVCLELTGHKEISAKLLNAFEGIDYLLYATFGQKITKLLNYKGLWGSLVQSPSFAEPRLKCTYHKTYSLSSTLNFSLTRLFQSK